MGSSRSIGAKNQAAAQIDSTQSFLSGFSSANETHWLKATLRIITLCGFNPLVISVGLPGARALI